MLRPALRASENGTDIAPLRPDRPAKCPEGGFSLATNEAPCFLIFHQRHHMSDLVILARVVTLDFESRQASWVNGINPAGDAHQIFFEALLGRHGAFHRGEGFWGTFNLGHGMRLPTSLPS